MSVRCIIENFAQLRDQQVPMNSANFIESGTQNKKAARVFHFEDI